MFNLQFSSVVHQTVRDVSELLGGRPKVFDPTGLLIGGTLAQIPGDYIEIGTWFGASALVTALVKKTAGIYGSVTCVDPFGGLDPRFYQAYRYAIPSKEAVLDSADKLGVELEIIAKPSNPWPEELEGRTWTVGYIDGDHRYPHPGLDAITLSNKVTQFLVFDDFSPNMRAVQMAVFDRLRNDPAWDLFLVYRNCAVLRRPADGQSIITYNLMEWIDPFWDWKNVGS